MDSKVSDVEKLTANLKEDHAQINLDDLIRIKSWPLMELVCWRLSSAVHRAVVSEDKRELTVYLVDALNNWFEATGAVPTDVAATVKHILNRPNLVQMANVELMFYLTDYHNISPAHTFPLALINWEETVTKDTENYTLLDTKASSFIGFTHTLIY